MKYSKFVFYIDDNDYIQVTCNLDLSEAEVNRIQDIFSSTNFVRIIRAESCDNKIFNFKDIENNLDIETSAFFIDACNSIRGIDTSYFTLLKTALKSE